MNQAAAKRALTIAVSIAGAVAAICFIVSLVLGWDSAAAAPVRTVALVAAILAAVIGVLFALLQLVKPSGSSD